MVASETDIQNRIQGGEKESLHLVIISLKSTIVGSSGETIPAHSGVQVQAVPERETKSGHAVTWLAQGLGSISILKRLLHIGWRIWRMEIVRVMYTFSTAPNRSECNSTKQGVVWAGSASRRDSDIKANHILTFLAWLEHDDEYSCLWFIYLCIYVGLHKWCNVHTRCCYSTKEGN